MLHTGGVDEETWHVKNATKDRKAKEMGEFSRDLHCSARCSRLVDLKTLQVLFCTKCYFVLPICLKNFRIFPRAELID